MLSQNEFQFEVASVIRTQLLIRKVITYILITGLLVYPLVLLSFPRSYENFVLYAVFLTICGFLFKKILNYDQLFKAQEKPSFKLHDDKISIVNIDGQKLELIKDKILVKLKRNAPALSLSSSKSSDEYLYVITVINANSEIRLGPIKGASKLVNFLKENSVPLQVEELLNPEQKKLQLIAIILSLSAAMILFLSESDLAVIIAGALGLGVLLIVKKLSPAIIKNTVPSALHESNIYSGVLVMVAIFSTVVCLVPISQKDVKFEALMHLKKAIANPKNQQNAELRNKYEAKLARFIEKYPDDERVAILKQATLGRNTASTTIKK